MKSIRARHIICILCLLLVGIGCGTSQKVHTDKYGVRESTTIDLLSKKKVRDQGKITFKCRISKFEDSYIMLAKVLKNDSAMHIVRPGIKFMLANGGYLMLKAERPEACCSSWADGRWYNAAFRLGATDIEKLKSKGIVSLSIYVPDGVVSCEVPFGKAYSVAEQLKSIDEN